MIHKIPVGIIGATGMVGQKFVALLENHPWFEVVVVAASSRSAGQPYSDLVTGRWQQQNPVPKTTGKLIIKEVEKDLEAIANQVRLVFSALDMDKEAIRQLENKLAKRGVAVVSNNSAHRWTEDVPMVLPEVNHHHLELIDIQRKNRGWDQGLIVVKPNCSIQSYVPALEALKKFGPEKVIVTTFQAISGAGKTFKTWPEMVDNVIPFINGEEEKTEREPLKIWGQIKANKLELAQKPQISANCIRVPVTDGHLALVNVAFKTKPTREQILAAWNNYVTPLKHLGLPSAPKQFLKYLDDEDRPQTKLDRDFEQGMGITIGRLRPDTILDWKFACLSHNTIRGAAGGAILTAELLKAKGYIN